MTTPGSAQDVLAGLLFLVFALAALYGAAVAVGARRLVRAVAGLALSFLGVAGLYYFLSSPFVAFMQVLIYIGAVCVTIVFAVMLADTSEAASETPKGKLPTLLGALCSAGVAAILLAAASTAKWHTPPAEPASGSLERVGVSLLTTYSMSFELISVVLLVAMIGSLVLARRGRDRQ